MTYDRDALDEREEDDKDLPQDERETAVDDRDERAFDDDEREESVEERQARRRAERAEKKQKLREKQQRQEALIRSQDKLLREMAARLEHVERRTGGFEVAAIDRAINEAQAVVAQAEQAMAKAIADGDGPTAAAAMKQFAAAQSALGEYNAVKRRGAGTQAPKAQALEVDPQVAANATAWMQRNDWYDPDGGDDDSIIAVAIENALFRSGSDPRNPRHWVELDKRLKARLPHRYGKVQEPLDDDDPDDDTPPRRRPPVGGSGRDAPRNGGKTFYLSKERRAALDGMGIREGSDEWKEYVSQYKAYDEKQKRLAR